MHRIINDIQIIIENAMKENLPEVSSDALEENGKVYYMNGKNGTEFDWFEIIICRLSWCSITMRRTLVP